MSVINNLAQFNFRAQPNTDDNMCVICQCDFEENDQVTGLPCNKNHIFHTQRLNEWLLNKTTCPLCNATISNEMIYAARNSQGAA